MIALIEQIVDPEKEEIILINSAKKYNPSSNQLVMGVEFFDPQFKPEFEARIKKQNYTFTELTIKDPLLKMLI